MNITLLGNYPPRRCGIATFTQHVNHGIQAAASRAVRTRVVAVNDPGRAYDYPAVVADRIEQQNLGDYLRVADALNADDTDVVLLQHEFGIFGGEAGAHVLAFAERLTKPLVVTLHTVLRQPDDQQRLVMLRLARRAQRIVVMSELAVRILRQVYRVPAGKIERIEHGSPVFDFDRRAQARRDLDLDGRHVALTFGLLGRGKGIETAIEALPALKEVAPDFLYVLLGRTHPHVIAHEGEAYREALWARVEQLGLADNVRFVDEYADEALLSDYLLAADTYVLPYPNEAQITSGTLSYAVGAGCAVLSTPFWHARELLAGGRGRLFPFGDSRALGRLLREQVDDPAAHAGLRAAARAYGEGTTWPAQGDAYLRTLTAATNEYVATPRRLRTAGQLPKLDLQHVRRLTDDTGMLQHATYHLPNRHEGYCLDDNVRALIFVAQALEAGGKVSELEPLLDTYLGLVHYLQRPDGQFVNFLGYGRDMLEAVGSEDSFGRTIWALGYLLRSRAVSQDHKDLAWQMYLGARPHIARLRSLRAVAFSVLGLVNLCESDAYTDGVRELIGETAQFLLDEFAAASAPADADTGEGAWPWYESVLTYGNAILPLATLRAGRALDDARYLDVARRATDFLESLTFTGDLLHPIGCETFMRRGGEPARFDQQPLEAMAMVYLYAAWHEATGDERELQRARDSYRWFEGHNDIGLPLYNAERGSCYDGLMAHGVNCNQGAESTLAYWLARGRLSEVLSARERDTAAAAPPTRLRPNSVRRHPARPDVAVAKKASAGTTGSKVA